MFPQSNVLSLVSRGRSVFGAVAFSFVAAVHPVSAADFVIQISIDGLGSSYLQNLIDLGEVPNFARLQTESAWTHNARTDFDHTTTLQNHTSMLTGRPVLDTPALPTGGHQYLDNGDPGSITLHGNRGFYLQSVFDVAHDNGLATGLYATKSKFVLYDQSYDAITGAPDLIGPDNGQDKIDVAVIPDGDSGAMTSAFLSNMTSSPSQFSFLHFFDADIAGHTYTWGSTEYNDAVKTVDNYLGSILSMIDSNATLQGRTAIILTADHGGFDAEHSDPTEPLIYTIPFYVWGAGVTAGADLYTLNSTTRFDPGFGRPDYSDPSQQPIRNADGGNLALSLLGLGPVAGSSINGSQNLAIPEPHVGGMVLLGALVVELFAHRRRTRLRSRDREPVA